MVFYSVLCAGMDISLDNPGFLMDVSDQVKVHQSDVPRHASGSSSSGEATRRSCSRCHGRMSSLSRDRHLFCIKCRGADCDLNIRCDECLSWTKEEMESYVKLRKSLTSKNRKSKSLSKSSSSPPWPAAPEFDLDSHLATQLDTVNKFMDQKLEDMSLALMSRFSAMFDQLRADFNQTSFAEYPAVLGPSVSQTEPPSLPHPVSTKTREGLRFRVSGEDPVPHGSGLAQNFSGSTRHGLGAEAAASRDPPPEDGESSQHPGGRSSSGFSYGGQAETESIFHPEDDDDEDRESVADPPVLDRTYARLVDFIYNRFAHSRPSVSAQLAPRCEFEDFLAVSDPPSASRQNLTVYPRVAEIIDSSAERASRLTRQSRPLHRFVPLRHKMFFVGDKPDFCNARYVNPAFARISKNKTILKSRNLSVSLTDLERIERSSRSILAGDSLCFWLLSSLLAQLKDDGYRPSDPALFDKNILSLSAALASQTMMAAGVTNFVSAKRRESYLAHATCPIAESVKRDLLVALGTESFLLDQPLLEKVVSHMKKDSLISLVAPWCSG